MSASVCVKEQLSYIVNDMKNECLQSRSRGFYIWYFADRIAGTYIGYIVSEMDGAIGELLIGGNNGNADVLTNLDDLIGCGCV